MCRNIKLLFHFEPPATDEEIRASALQYVRKLSGIGKPTAANAAAFERAVEEITTISTRLLRRELLPPHSAPRTREAEKEKAKARGRSGEERMRAKILAGG